MKNTPNPKSAGQIYSGIKSPQRSRPSSEKPVIYVEKKEKPVIYVERKPDREVPRKNVKGYMV